MAITEVSAPARPPAPPLQRSSGRVVLSGNEMIVKGALEAGVSLITGYPGSPVAEVFSVCEANAPHLRELGVEAVLANNEAQSAAMLNGQRAVPGTRGLAVFKSVGAYVATDGLAIANAALPGAGAASVVAVGDDPSLSSTQVGADSRITMSGIRVPVLEPSSNQEIKDFVRLAFELSAEAGLIVAVVVSTTQADGTGVVEAAANVPPAVGPKRRVTLDTAAVPVSSAVSLPPYSTDLEVDLLRRRLPAVQARIEALGLDREDPLLPGALRRVGIVTAGASYPLVRHALAALGLDGLVPVLRLALTWPVHPEHVTRFADTVDEVLVVEERSGLLEDQVRRALEGRRQPVWGKRFPDGPGFPESSGLNPDLAARCLARLVLSRPADFPAEGAPRAEALLERDRALTLRSLAVTPRTPTYCAGCPHRGTSSPMLEIRRRMSDPAYMRRVHGRGPVDVIAHGGIGCYSMAFLPPYEEMHDLSAMGLGGATGAGSAPHVTNKHYTLVGDGTFFHGEMSTIANAIKQRQDILFVILDNKNTAMTGHQGTPGSETDLMGRPQNPLRIEEIVRAMNPDFLARSNPDDRDAHLDLLERALLMEGTRVVVADKECAITSGRRARRARAAEVARRGYEAERTRFNVVEEVCENCRECTVNTGCPGLTLIDTPLGEKVGIDKDICVDDGYCAKIKACPSFELVTVTRRRAPATAPAAEGIVAPPDPALPEAEDGWSIYLAGIGGMGIGVVARILTEAGAARWPEIDVYHKKGIAIRNGGVFSEIVMHDGRRPRPAEIPAGGADLLIGMDALEGARALAYADPARTAAVLNTGRTPTVTMLTGREGYPDDLVERAAAHTRPGGLLATDFAAACERALGDRIYANLAMLGAAWQRGLVPIERGPLEAAIREVTGRQAEANLRALSLGRAMAARDEAPPAEEPASALLAREEAWLPRGLRGAFRAARERAEGAGLGEAAMRMLAPRLPEILVWGGAGYAARYLDGVERVAAAVPALVPAAIHNLHRAMAIKDEVFVAYQLTSEKKYARDRERFGVDPARGDRIGYVHLNRPALDLAGRRLEFDLRAHDWMLRLGRRARFLRRLPGWHVRERAFRDWYEGEVVGAVAEGRLSGAAAEEALGLPSTVTGFREVRYPREDAARARFAELLAGDRG